MGSRVGFTTDVGVAEPAGGAIATLDEHRKPKPALVGLAIAGWATFAVQWIVVLVIILGRGGTPNNITVAQAQPAPRPAVTNPAPPPAPEIPAPKAQAPTPKPQTTTPPKATPQPAVPNIVDKPKTTPPPKPVVVDKSNPLLNPTPNVMNVELQPGHTAVLFDAVDRSKYWYNNARKALIAGLSHQGSGQTISLFAVSDGKVIAYPKNPFTPSPARRAALTTFLDPIEPIGKGGLGASLDAAVASGAKEVVFVTGRSTGWGAYLETLKKKLNSGDRTVKLHIVQMGEESPELKTFIEGENEGEYQQVWFKPLEAWLKAAE
ncbi:MAG: hypothetical protein AAGA25_00685 [Planctomycetota bacterium]